MKLCIHKFGNLDKIDQSIEKHKLPKVTQGEIDNMNMNIPQIN